MMEEEMSDKEIEEARKLLLRANLSAPFMFIGFVLRGIVNAPVLMYNLIRGRVTGEEFGDRVAYSMYAIWDLAWGTLEAALMLPIMAMGWLNRQVGPYSGIGATGVVVGGAVAGAYVSFMNPNAGTLLIINIVWVTALVFFASVFLFAIYAQNKIAEEEADE